MDDQPHNPQEGPYGYPPRPPYGAPPQPVRRPKGDGMATAAMILGILTLISLLLLRILVPFVLSGVGIMLAILSRGGAKKLMGKAKAGLICCTAALCLDLALCVSSVCLMFALPNLSPELTKEVNKICEEQYGISYNEMMEQFYGIWDSYDLMP